MFVRYKLWDRDGIDGHKVNINHLEAVFLDSNKGIADIRDKRLLDALLGRTQYELAYERYGVFWDEKNQQVNEDPSIAKKRDEEAKAKELERFKKAREKAA